MKIEVESLNIGNRIERITQHLMQAYLIFGDDTKQSRTLSLAQMALHKLISDLRAEQQGEETV